MIGISSRIVPKLYLSMFDRIKYFTEIFVLNFSFFCSHVSKNLFQV